MEYFGKNIKGEVTMADKNPVGREKHHVDGQGSVNKRGSGLGTGPVGKTDGRTSSTGGSSSGSRAAGSAEGRPIKLPGKIGAIVAVIVALIVAAIAGIFAMWFGDYVVMVVTSAFGSVLMLSCASSFFEIPNSAYLMVLAVIAGLGMYSQIATKRR